MTRRTLLAAAVLAAAAAPALGFRGNAPRSPVYCTGAVCHTTPPPGGWHGCQHRRSICGGPDAPPKQPRRARGER